MVTTRVARLSLLAPWALVALVGLTTTAASAAVPGQIAVHGVLRTTGGAIAADGAYKATFAIYPAAKDGAAIWSEGPVDLYALGGRFSYTMGATKAVDGKALAALPEAWLGLQLGNDPEFPRGRLTAVPFAMHATQASSLACSGCIGADAFKKGSLSADLLSFTFAGSKTKGGPAAQALDLACTGCVSVDELKIDKDLDLGGNALKAAKISAGDVLATNVSASSFIGDGSKLTGLKVPDGTCKGADEVVVGIAADGSLKCTKVSFDPKLPPDGLNEVSNGLLTNEFADVANGATGKAILDNNPIGIFDEIDFPDVGLAKTFQINLHVSNSDISGLEITVFDPNNAKYALHDGGGAGAVLKTSYPTPTKTVTGDLGAWVGKNAKGKWRLKIIDKKAKVGGGEDGKLEAWSVQIGTVSNKVVQATGLLDAAGGFRLKTAAAPPVTCAGPMTGYVYFDTKLNALQICNGKKFFPIFTDTPGGSESNPGTSCKAILDAGASKGDGTYWIDPDGLGGPENKFQAWCDMTTQGGGWTLIFSARRLNRDSFDRHGSDTWDSNIATVNPTLKNKYHLFRKMPFTEGLRAVCFNNENFRTGMQAATVDIVMPKATAAAFQTYLKANTAYNIGDTSNWYDVTGKKRWGSNGPDDFYLGGPIVKPQYEQVNWGWVDYKASACSASALKWSGGGSMSQWANGERKVGDWFILVR